jgi:transcriptional regulator with XRE-family HTH domain
MADSAAEAARKAFAEELRGLRKDAGLNGRQLAAMSGMHYTKVSRIENGGQNPSEDDIRAWCIACGVARRIPELIAAHREVEQMWTEHRRNLRAGLVHVQARDSDLYARTGLLRVYHSSTVPGILHTQAYSAAGLATVAVVHGRPVEEAEPAAAAKAKRQQLITAPTGRNTYAFVIEAGALEHGFGGMDIMNRQLDFLIEVTRMPHVSLGIIPPLPDRPIRPGEDFYIFDTELVRSEMWTGTMATRRAEQIAFYVKIFAMLNQMAVVGDAARELIEDARIRMLHSAATS